MSSLKRRLGALQQQMGTAGLVISCLALVMAMSGGAYAASKALTGKQKKEVEKIAKKYAGKPGAPGAQGAAGSNGKDGSNGSNGKDGAAGQNGAPGANGKDGANGESVTITTLTAGQEGCAQGGAKFANKTGTSKACNGLTGFTKTLPSEETETGVWSVVSSGATQEYAPVSFSIPLSAAAAATIKFHISSEPGFATFCTGEADDPKAEPGHLCVYRASSSNFGNPTSVQTPGGKETTAEEGVGSSGVFIYYESMPAGSRELGSFAITAP